MKTMHAWMAALAMGFMSTSCFAAADILNVDLVYVAQNSVTFCDVGSSCDFYPEVSIADKVLGGRGFTVKDRAKYTPKTWHFSADISGAPDVVPITISLWDDENDFRPIWDGGPVGGREAVWIAPLNSQILLRYTKSSNVLEVMTLGGGFLRIPPGAPYESQGVAPFATHSASVKLAVSRGAANNDADGDLISDRTEINTTRTDPVKSDSDNDGLKDGDEVNILHSDPRDGKGYAFPVKKVIVLFSGDAIENLPWEIGSPGDYRSGMDALVGKLRALGYNAQRYEYIAWANQAIAYIQGFSRPQDRAGWDWAWWIGGNQSGFEADERLRSKTRSINSNRLNT